MKTRFTRRQWWPLLLGTLLLLAPAAQAQRFWLLTYSFPEGPKTGLILHGDSVLCTAVARGVLRSSNQGRSWTVALRANAIGKLYRTRTGLLLAGGPGKVYRSTDAGLSWDSATVATPHSVNSFVETRTGGLLAGTGVYDLLDGYLGSGAFYSADQGRTWTSRSNGLAPGRFVNQLAADAAGRLYLTVADEDLPQYSGLYRSLDEGLSWQKQAIRIGRGLDYLTAYEVTTLSVRPQQDSLMLSFKGSGGNFAVQLNLTKSLADLGNDAAYWTIQPALFSSTWWDGTVLNNVHFARNGDWYSSRASSMNNGGTLVSKDRGRTWARTQQGLGLDSYGRRGVQYFAEASDGKVLMVQHLDERVYWTDASIVTATHPSLSAAPLALYPNPAATTLHLELPAGATLRTLTLTDLGGRLVRRFSAPTHPQSRLTFDLSGTAAGMYLVTATLADGQMLRQRLVKQ